MLERFSSTLKPFELFVLDNKEKRDKQAHFELPWWSNVLCVQCVVLTLCSNFVSLYFVPSNTLTVGQDTKAVAIWGSSLKYRACTQTANVCKLLSRFFSQMQRKKLSHADFFCQSIHILNRLVTTKGCFNTTGLTYNRSHLRLNNKKQLAEHRG